MNRAERIEAAHRVYSEFAGMSPTERLQQAIYGSEHLEAKAILDAAYPELASGTHVLMPREPTDEIIQALRHAVGKERFGDIDAMVFWQEEIVSAYERSKPESE